MCENGEISMQIVLQHTHVNFEANLSTYLHRTVDMKTPDLQWPSG